MSDVPVTFVEPSYALFDVDANGVLTTKHGSLAIFSTRGMADLWASRSARRVVVKPVYIKPATATHHLNDAPVLEQVNGQYEKFLMMVLHKYLPAGVIITTKDIEEILKEQDQGDPWILFTHGHKDSFEFKAIRESEAQRLIDHDKATQRGQG
jgi:hypothetical protein